MTTVNGSGGPFASGKGEGGTGSGACYIVPAYQVQSGDTYASIIEGFYGDTSPNECIINALISFNPVGAAGCAVGSCDWTNNNYPTEGLWVLLPTQLYDGTTTYDFACDTWDGVNSTATGLVGNAGGNCAISCGGFATVSDTCNAGTC